MKKFTIGRVCSNDRWEVIYEFSEYPDSVGHFLRDDSISLANLVVVSHPSESKTGYQSNSDSKEISGSGNSDNSEFTCPDTGLRVTGKKISTIEVYDGAGSEPVESVETLGRDVTIYDLDAERPPP